MDKENGGGRMTEEEFSKPDVGALVQTFKFPKNARTACEQYLIYFGQFLKDLGIEADLQLDEQGEQVLFKVTPREGLAVRSKIREALTLYLELPFSQDLQRNTEGITEIAVLQLSANVMHFISQLILAGAITQARDAFRWGREII